MYFNKNKFPELPFCGPYSKPHESRGLSGHYHLIFYTKLGNGIFEIRRIPCAYVACTSILDKPWTSGITSDEKDSYKLVANCTYWPVLGSFKSWNIIQFSQKSTPYDAFDSIQQVVLDRISENRPR